MPTYYDSTYPWQSGMTQSPLAALARTYYGYTYFLWLCLLTIAQLTLAEWYDAVAQRGGVCHTGARRGPAATRHGDGGGGKHTG